MRGDGSAKSSSEIVVECAEPEKEEFVRSFPRGASDPVRTRESRLTDDAEGFGFNDGFRGADRMCRRAPRCVYLEVRSRQPMKRVLSYRNLRSLWNPVTCGPDVDINTS